MHEAVTLADRVILLEEGHTGLDADINLAHPRDQNQPGFTVLAGQILARIFTGHDGA